MSNSVYSYILSGLPLIYVLNNAKSDPIKKKNNEINNGKGREETETVGYAEDMKKLSST